MVPLSAEALEGLSRQELVALVLVQSELIQSLQAELVSLRSKVAEMEERLGQNSGNSSTPPSRDPVAERQRQAQQRAAKQEQAGGAKRRRGKQRGARGTGLKMSENPDVIVDHRPGRCEDCGQALAVDSEEGFTARQVVDIPEVTPTVTEHRAYRCRCSCGHVSTGQFPSEVRAPVSYGIRVKAVVAYL